MRNARLWPITKAHLSHLRFVTRHDFICFDPEVILLLLSKFWFKSTKARFGNRCLKLIFKMVAVAAFLDFQLTQF